MVVLIAWTFVYIEDRILALICSLYKRMLLCNLDLFFPFLQPILMLSPASKASRQVANLTWRKNTHTPIYGVKEFVCLSAAKFDLNYLRTGEIEWAKFFLNIFVKKCCPNTYPDSHHSQGVWNLPHKFHLYLIIIFIYSLLLMLALPMWNIFLTTFYGQCFSQ